MEKGSLTKQIRGYLLGEQRMDLVGFCPASALDKEPEGYRPTDILKCARSVVVFGRRLLNGAVQAQMRRLEDGAKYAESIYSTYGLELVPNWTMALSTFYLADYIENNFGGTTQPLGCGPEMGTLPKNTPLPMFAGPNKDGLVMNIAHAAIAAGIAQPGWNNFPITREYGPRVQFGCLLTDLELVYDAPDDGERLCDPAKCRVCSDRCPMRALPPKESGEETVWRIAGREYAVAKHNVNACTVAALGMRSEFAGIRDRGDLVKGMDPTDAEIAEGIRNYEISNCNLDHYPKCYCNVCQIYCPVGSWAETFGPLRQTKEERN